VQLYRDDGIVLRTQKLGEADRIITILARGGRIRAVAKGVRRTKSRFGARLEPFTHVDLMLHAGRSLDVITQAEVIRPYGEPLTGDYPRYTAGVAMLETAERFTPVEKEPALRQLLLLIGGLRALGDGEHASGLVLDAFLLRSLAVAGYAPALQECARCGVPDQRLPGFAVAAGGMVCASCRPPGAASPAAPTVALMLALLRGDWDGADRSERRHRVECSGLVAAYLQWHLEHSIRSLRHVERVLCRRGSVRPIRIRAGLNRRTYRPNSFPGTSPWSWTATGAGLKNGGCPGPRATRMASPRCST
jgi:DNA repair protein RecO (recombination protein O)